MQKLRLYSIEKLVSIMILIVAFDRVALDAIEGNENIIKKGVNRTLYLTERRSYRSDEGKR